MTTSSHVSTAGPDRFPNDRFPNDRLPNDRFGMLIRRGIGSLIGADECVTFTAVRMDLA
jgi:hypothetical protein